MSIEVIYGPCGRHGVYEEHCWACAMQRPFEARRAKLLASIERSAPYLDSVELTRALRRFQEESEPLIRAMARIESMAPPSRLLIKKEAP